MRTRTASRWVGMVAVAWLFRVGDVHALPAVSGLGHVSQPIAQTYFVPMPAQPFYQFFDSVNSNIGTSQVHTVESIVVHQPGTVIVYDHWEDGYEADPSNPTQATTQIWGDGNPAHGIPPGHTNNVLKVGDVIVMEEDQNLPRSAPPATNAVFAYDGGDRISSTRVISMQAGGWPLPDADSAQPDPGYMFASMVDLYPTNRWGTDFVIPLGGNVQAPASNPSFNFSTLMVQAGDNATTVQIDTNGDGTVDVTTNLSLGQTCYLPNDGVRAGATVHATKPVQVDLLTGRLGANYEARGFTIQPTNRIGHSYYTPVSTGTATGPNSDGGSHPTTVFLFNPGASSITVHVDTTLAGSTNLIVGAKSTVGYTLADGNAAHFSSTGAPFVALSVSDTGSSSTAFEWGYTLLDELLLTADVRAGWAPGSVGGSGAPNASPVWVTAVSNTTLYVDLDGDGATGPLVDPNGNHYNFTTNVLTLQPIELYDSSDLNQTGMHIYDLTGVKLAGAWGENGSIAHPQLNVDLGYALAPLNDTSIGNSIWLDLNGNGVQDANEPGLANVKVTLSGPGGTVVTYTDSNGNYLFPDLQPGIYTVTVDASTLPAGLVQSYDPDGTLNNTTVHTLAAGEAWLGCDFGYKGNAAIGDTVWEDTNANGAQDPGEAGFSNVAVVVTYAGTDGVFGTADDVVARQVTDANGHYFATKLPGGLYRVELDPATIPTGYAFTTAPQLTHALSGGETWLEADFGLRYPHTKFLYLSDGEVNGVQGMDRIDPIYTHDATTAASVEIGRREPAQTWTAADQFLSVSYANSDGTQAWAADWNESDAGGTSGASDGNIKVASGSLQITTKNTADWVQRAIDLSGTDAATVTVVVTSSTLTSSNPVKLQASKDGGASWTTLATYNSTATGTYSYNLAATLGTPLTAGTAIRFSSGGTGTKVLKIAEVRVDDHVAAVTSPSSTIFTQSAPMAATYIVPPNGVAQVTAYLVAPYGNIPLTNAAIAASLSYGNTTFATLTNPAVYRLAPPVVYSVADDFESNGYAGNTGTANWSGNWTEVGESDGAATGDERVMSDSGSLVLRIMHSGEGVVRAANLTSAGYATLSFDYRLAGTFSAGQGYYVQASADGSTWTTVATLSGAQSSSYKHFTVDVSDFISAQTTVRIVEFGTSNTAYFDNVKIEYGTRVSYYRLEWTGVAPMGATIADGQRVALTVTDTSTNSEPFQIQYDSQTKPSLVQLAADRIINVDSLAVYTLSYPGGVVTTNGDPNTVVYVRTTVSDPFGAYDITSLDLAFAPSGTVGSVHLIDANVVVSTTGTKTYEVAWNTGPLGTNYTIAATAAEGTEGMKTVTFTVFGVKPMGNVAGTVFLDQNGDGVPDAADTNSLAGVTVMLKSNGTVVATTATDAAGRYVFTNLVPGAYTIVETDLVGYTSTLPANNQLAVTVINGQTVTGYNFYDTLPGNIAGSVRLDVDGDGVAEAVDTNGIAGVTVTLKNAGGTTVASTTTTAGGTYLFANVMPGAYTLVETDPSGYVSTTDTALPNDNQIPVTLASGQTSTGNTFYDTHFASVGGKVRVDASGNGVADATDTNGIAGVTVSLKNAGGTVVATTTTDATGSYAFANVLPGAAYTIVETDLAGYTSTLPVNNTLTVSLVSGTASTGNNFYDTLPGTVRGSVLVDVNGDGIVQTVDTNAIVGVTVTLKQGGTVIGTATTDANGGYSFTNVMPGSYTVVETDLAGYSSTLPTDNTDPVTVTAGSTTTALFYDTQKTAISGNVRLDLNGDGVVDTTDTNGIAAVTVTLKQGSTTVATTTTSANGAYSFTNVMPGAYTIVETDPAGCTSTLPVNNTLTVSLVSGTASTGNNFYDTLPGTVRGSVLVDVNGDGIVQTGDTNAIAGVTVTLKQGSTVVATTTTSASGAYSFTNVLPGAYSIIETDLAGYTSTLPVDNTDAVTVTAGGTATALFYDTQKTAISGNVRLDLNGDGVVDTVDTNGIAAVTVTLKQGSTVVATTTTSASGAYSFTNVLPGAYMIVETDLAGYTSTLPVNNTLMVTLVSGTASTDNNFYDTLPGTVRGSVLVDLDGDGVAQGGDTNGISGVTVTLKSGSTVIGTATTDAQGGYTFTNVMPGNYTVVETDLAGYSSTLPVNNTDPVTVTAGSTATALFYDTQKTAISGNVRLDVNGNGVVDTADTNGIAAVTVTLKQGSTLVATTTTSASGAYSFTNVMPGAYTIIEIDLAGYTSTLPVNNTLTVTLLSGTASTGNNFYDTLPGTVRGSVLVDVDGDGVAEAIDTNAIAGVTVTLNQGSTVIGTATTDAQGGYTFTNVMPGNYTVVETDLAGYSSTLPVDNTDAVTVTAGSTATALFYDTQKTAISGNVRLDVNGNGVVDATDTNGIAGVTVTLKSGSTVVATTTTSASGAYSFTNVMPGAYTIVETDLAGYSSTLPVNNTLAVTLVSGTASTGNNFYDTVLMPGVRVVKTAGSAPDGSPYVLSAAGPVTYTYVVSNIGNTYLNSVTVTDNKIGAIGSAAGTLAPGTSVTLTATVTVSASVTNIATVTAHPTDSAGADLPGVTNVTATDAAIVLLAMSNGTCDPLGIATNFNALIFGDLAAAGGDTEGRLAVGGTARFTIGYSVGIPVVGEPIAQATGNVDRLIVGADLYDGSWDVNGNTVYGGTRYGPVKWTGKNSIRHVSPVTFNAVGNVPMDGSGATFSMLLEQLRATSSALGALADSGVMTKKKTSTRYKLAGTNDQLNVFNVQAQDWSCSQSDIVITAPTNSTVLVNIHGASASLSNGAMRVTGVTPNNVLFNYVDATEIDTASFDHMGSVLAPYANAHLHSGEIEGSAVFGGDVVTETGFEFHNFPFRGHVCVTAATPGAGTGGSGVEGLESETEVVEYRDGTNGTGSTGSGSVTNVPGNGGGSGGAATSAWQRADFAVTTIALVNPPTLAGDVFGAQVTVVNNGEIAGDAGQLAVYVSQPDNVTAGTVGDAALTVGVLQPGESRTFEFANLKSDVRSGTHHFRAFVNSEETTAEWSFGDNQLSTTYQVSAISLSLSLTSDGVQLAWNSFWGQKYSLYRSTLPTGPFTLVQEHIKAAPPTNTFRDAKQPGMAFYRLQVEQP